MTSIRAVVAGGGRGWHDEMALLVILIRISLFPIILNQVHVKLGSTSEAKRRWSASYVAQAESAEAWALCIPSTGMLL